MKSKYIISTVIVVLVISAAGYYYVRQDRMFESQGSLIGKIQVDVIPEYQPIDIDPSRAAAGSEGAFMLKVFKAFQNALISK